MLVHARGVCARVCVCMRVYALCVFTQLEVESGMASPGTGSWGGCRDPTERQTGSGTLSTKQEDLTYPSIPALELKLQAKSLQNPR